MRKFAWFIVFCLISTASSAGQSFPEAAKEEVRKALSEFITAFDNLDWEHFRAAFADDATVFYPREFPNRASGRTEIERNFRHVFEVIRAGRTKPPLYGYSAEGSGNPDDGGRFHSDVSPG